MLEKGLDVGVHGFSEVSGKACGGQCSVFSAHDAGPESAQGKNYHNSTHPIDMADISGFHTLINNGSHGQGDQSLKENFQDHEKRREKRGLFKLPDLGQKGFEHKKSPFFYCSKR